MKFQNTLLFLGFTGAAIGLFHEHFVLENGYLDIYFDKSNAPFSIAKEPVKNKKNAKENINNEHSDIESSETQITYASNSDNDLVVSLDYDFFQLDYNCDKGGFNYFTYTTVPDQEDKNYSRYGAFHYDKQIGEKCNYDKVEIKKAKNTGTYKSPSRQHAQYDRGHGNHQNIWDHDKAFMKITNYMSNIVPQEKNQNRQGLWRHSEKLTECYRDEGTVKIFGGNVWGTDESNDFFVKSHGVVTPDHLFKILIIDGKPYSFIIPNDPKAKKNNASNYMLSINDIENAVGYTFDIEDSLKSIVNKKLPPLPKCSIK
jgi:endonuclease G